MSRTTSFDPVAWLGAFEAAGGRMQVEGDALFAMIPLQQLRSPGLAQAQHLHRQISGRNYKRRNMVGMMVRARAAGIPLPAT